MISHRDTTQPLLVGRGVDTLVLNVSYRDGRHKPCKRDLPQAMKEQLDAWKQAAVIAEEPIPVPYTFEGVNLHMYPNGAGKGQWRWLLRLVVPGSDSNRSRWPTHAVWQAVQRAFAVGPDAGSDQGTVIRERKRQANLQRATAAAVGYLSSMAAWLGRDGTRGDDTDLTYIIHWLRERTPIYLGARSRAFAQEVAKKRVRFEQQRLYEHVAYDHGLPLEGND